MECRKLGIPSVGIERNPIAWFASRTKLDWSLNPEALVEHASAIAAEAQDELERQGIDDFRFGPLFDQRDSATPELRALSPDRQRLLLKNSISPVPLHKTLVLLDALERHRSHAAHSHERLALAAALVSGISNLRFGPEVGVRRIQSDAPVVSDWLRRVQTMASDLRAARNWPRPAASVHLADSRGLELPLEAEPVDAVNYVPSLPQRKGLHANDAP